MDPDITFDPDTFFQTVDFTKRLGILKKRAAGNAGLIRNSPFISKLFTTEYRELELLQRQSTIERNTLVNFLEQALLNPHNEWEFRPGIDLVRGGINPSGSELIIRGKGVLEATAQTDSHTHSRGRVLIDSNYGSFRIGNLSKWPQTLQAGTQLYGTFRFQSTLHLPIAGVTTNPLKGTSMIYRSDKKKYVVQDGILRYRSEASLRVDVLAREIQETYFPNKDGSFKNLDCMMQLYDRKTGDRYANGLVVASGSSFPFYESVRAESSSDM